MGSKTRPLFEVEIQTLENEKKLRVYSLSQENDKREIHASRLLENYEAIKIKESDKAAREEWLILPIIEIIAFLEFIGLGKWFPYLDPSTGRTVNFTIENDQLVDDLNSSDIKALIDGEYGEI